MMFGLFNRAEGQPPVPVRPVVMMLMRPQSVAMLQRAVHTPQRTAVAVAVRAAVSE